MSPLFLQRLRGGITVALGVRDLPERSEPPTTPPNPPPRPRGSSKAGRPKKKGARKPCGRLKPKREISRAVEIRSALLGVDPVTGKTPDGRKLDITTASNAMDLALARSFISEEMHRTAARIALIHRRADLRGPQCRTQDYHEVEAAAALKFQNFATLPDDEIVALFDKVFCEVATPEDREARAGTANDLWAVLMNGLDPAVQSQVYEVCVLESWPQWLVYRCAGKEVPPGFARREAQLQAGLETIADRLKRHAPPKPLQPVKPGDRGAPDPVETRRRGPILEQRVLYVDEDGQPIATIGDKTGAPFEVYRRSRP